MNATCAASHLTSVFHESSQLYDAKTPIDQFLAAAAAKQPTPGGGSIAALAGALAASMGEMVVNYSLGKKSLEAHSDALKTAVAELSRASAILIELMIADQQAYEAFTAARKIPQSPARASAIGDAAMICIRIPEAIGATAVAILEIADRLVDIVNPYLLSDLAVCADLAMATTRCAIYNIRVNLPEITDSKHRWEIEATSAHLLSRGLLTIQRVSPRIWQRVAAMQSK